MLHAKVLSRDECHLTPRRISRAAGARLRAGIAALEPSLSPDQSEYVRTHRPRLRRGTARPFRIFRTGHTFAGINPGFSREILLHRGPVEAAPLLARLSALKALIEAPEQRARRLAFHLARKRPGPLFPQLDRRRVPRRYGTELSALYTALGAAVTEASRARPPPLGPRPRAGPRIRQL